MKNLLSIIPYTICLLFILSPFQPSAAEDRLEPARQFLKLEPVAAKKQIETMSPTEASGLISQIRFLKKQTHPDLDHLYYLLEHLQTLKATALAQKRLNNLLWVLGLTLALFSIFFIYIIWDQRGAIAKLEALSSSIEEKTPTKKAPEIYRGESG